MLYASTANDYLKKLSCDKLIKKSQYSVCYSYKHKGALGGYATLYADEVNRNNIKKRPKFYADKKIPKKYRSYYRDYTGHGKKWNRGHFIIADAAADHSKRTLNEAYSMANIIPQSTKVNQRTWTKVEKYGRKLATKYGKIISVSIAKYPHKPKEIKNSVAIPSKLFRIYLNEEKGIERCFEYDNVLLRSSKGDKLRDHEINCSILK
jgi:endonuclease G, mitochondrial